MGVFHRRYVARLLVIFVSSSIRHDNMGLCKCPKRRVTNQFCFEHRVNVCEHCMVTNHPKVMSYRDSVVRAVVEYLYPGHFHKITCNPYMYVIHDRYIPILQCIVQSYLLWLHDHDYNPICTLCSNKLSDGDCVRLTCYHMYHWVCLDRYARDLPATTAPAGYTCPACQTCIFPQAKLVSPVADVLREKLATVNWARAGLGLPLVRYFPILFLAIVIS